MKTRTRISLMLAAAGAMVLVGGGMLIVQQQTIHPAERPPAGLAASPAPAPEATAPKPQKQPQVVTSSRQLAPVTAPDADNHLTTNRQKEAAASDKSINYNGYQFKDPAARIALYFVGTCDAEADTYWESAIFDSKLPAEERKDLIEDLNETGMADPHHPGATDLPLIMARIRLIEQLEPYSIDQVDAAAFEEAYKDLVGLVSGQPPQ